MANKTGPTGDVVTRVRAAGMLHSLSGPGHQQRLADAIGDEFFAEGRLAGLSKCVICGVLGDEGDLCGRSPEGHRLTVRTGRGAR